MPEKQTSVIKNVIFDLGGVLLNINPLLSLIELEKTSGIELGELKIRLESEKIFEKLDTGMLNPVEFRQHLCRIMGKFIPDAEIDRIWNILLLDFPAPRVELLQRLKKNYRIFLLSNTNIIHFWHYTQNFHSVYGIQMTDLFEQLFLSYEIGKHKPDAAIFTYMLEKAGINSSESIFFDDTIQNITAANQLGIAGVHITKQHDVTYYFEDGILNADTLKALKSSK